MKHLIFLAAFLSSIVSAQAVNLTVPGGQGADKNDISRDVTIPAGKTLDVSAGTLTLADDQIAEAKVSGLTEALTAKANQLTPEMFGGIGDGVTDDTAALQQMLDAAAGTAGDGIEAYIPLGKTYRWSHILFIKSDTVLRWHGTLKMVNSNAKQAGPFPVTGGFPPDDAAGVPGAGYSTIGLTNSNGWQFQPEAPSGAAGAEEPFIVDDNITIIGDGLGVLDGNIEGQDSDWYTSGDSGAHRGMDFYNVQKLSVSGIKIRGFTTFAVLCGNVADFSFDQIEIDNSQNTWRTGSQGASQDGIHIARNCVRGKITRGKIKSADDCVAMEVTGAGFLRDVVVDDMQLEVVSPSYTTDYATSARGVWLGRYYQAGFDDSASWYIKRISVSNIRVTGIGRAFGVNGGRTSADIGKLREVEFRNIYAFDFTYNKDAAHYNANGNAVAAIIGTDESLFENIDIRNFARGGLSLSGIRNTRLKGLRFRDQVDAGALWTATTTRAAIFCPGVAAPTSYSATSIRRTSNVTTVVTSAVHGFTTGDAVNVRGCVNAPSLNAESAVITVLSTTSFTYANTGTDIGVNSDDTLARVTLDPFIDIVGSEIELASVENMVGGALHQHESVNATRVTWRDCVITAPRIYNIGVGGAASDGYNPNMARAAIGLTRTENVSIRNVRINGVTGGFGVFIDKNRGGLTIDDCEVRNVCVGQAISRGRGVQIANVVGASASSSTVRRVGNIAVVTLSTAHAFHRGDWVSIVGATTDTAFNQTLVQIDVISTTVIRYVSTGADVTGANGDDALLRITSVNLSADVRAITNNTAGNGMYFENVRTLNVRGQVDNFSVGSTANTGVDVVLAGVSGLVTTSFSGTVAVDVNARGEAYGVTVRASALPASVNSGNYNGDKIVVVGTQTAWLTAPFLNSSDLGYSSIGLLPSNGGTGVNNGTKTITLGGNFVTSGANALTLTTTGLTNVTIPISGTLSTLSGSEALTNKSVNGVTLTGSGGSTLAVGTGGTLGTAAYTASTAYATATQGATADAAAAVQATTPLATYAAGTAYSLTASDAAIDFGTTDPTITIATAGTYLIQGRALLTYNGATYAGNQTATLHLQRTNNTPAAIANATTTATMRIVTTITDTVGVMPLPPVIYTASAGDVITIYGAVSATPAAGSVDCTEASLVAVRLH